MIASDSALQVTGRYFVAGLELANGKVIRAAPIVKYMKRWTEAQVRAYCEQRGWSVERC